MKHIFVSYSRKDRKTVDHIVARLIEDGLEVWIDREEITGGELWRESIVKAIDNAYAFILMLSPDSVASDNVRKEIDLADGAKKKFFVPVLLKAVKLPAKLRYQLAGIQWVEYYRTPEKKYAELVKVLRSHTPKRNGVKRTQDVEIVIKGLKPSKFGQKKQEELLRFVAELTGSQRSELKLTALKSGSVHAFISMPEDAAYRLKTAALNRDSRLINFGIDALRLSSDRNFVFLKTGQIAPLKPPSFGGSRLFISTVAVTVSMLLASTVYSMLEQRNQITATSSPSITPTKIITLTPNINITYGPDPEDFPPDINPLTGLPACDPELLKLPAVLVSITNFPASARPQAGLSFSPVIYEIYISEGTTRFLAVFYGECPQASGTGTSGDQVGPVRSARLPYVDIKAGFPRSCLIYASASDEVLPELTGCGEIVYGANPNDINSAFVPITSMNQIAEANLLPGLTFSYSGNLFSDMIPSGGQSADQLNVFYSNLNQAQWSYDQLSGQYRRSENHPNSPDQFAPATDRLTTQQLAFSNIIVMIADHTAVTPTIIDIDMAQDRIGDAYLFRDGQTFKIRWTTVNAEYEQETGLRRPIRFIDESGKPIALKPGHTWVHVMSYDSTLSERSPDQWFARFVAPAGSK